MAQWNAMREDYFTWLRAFPLMVNIGQPSDALEVIPPCGQPTYLNWDFWSERTHEAEALARKQLSDNEIDRIFDEVAAVIDEDLRRFDPLVKYFGRFFPDGDSARIEDERQVAHAAKRDLAWAGIERAIQNPGFFVSLLPWYDKGRWPCNWSGQYPAGHVLVL